MPSKKDLDRFRGEVGEAIVAYELMKREWDVMSHLGGQGYDLLARKGNVTRAIEVKTTDPQLKTGTARNQLTMILSKAEQENADFLVFMFMGSIPTSSFPSGPSQNPVLSR